MKKAMVILSVLLVAFLIFGALSRSKPKLSRKTASSYHDQQLAEGFTHVKLLVPPDKKFCSLVIAEHNHSGKLMNWGVSYLPGRQKFKVEIRKKGEPRQKHSATPLANLGVNCPPQAREFPGNIDLYVKIIPGGYHIRSEIFGTSGTHLPNRNYYLISDTVKPGEFVFKSSVLGQNILSADNKNLAPNETGIIFLLLEKPEDAAKLSEMIKCTFMKKKKNQNL